MSVDSRYDAIVRLLKAKAVYEAALDRQNELRDLQMQSVLGDCKDVVKLTRAWNDAREYTMETWKRWLSLRVAFRDQVVEKAGCKPIPYLLSYNGPYYSTPRVR
jgi:hypothetical protein